MSRRDTIIIAVLVNAALLVVLFLFSITSKEDLSKKDAKLAKLEKLEEITVDAKELFSSENNIVVDNNIATKELVPKEAQNEFISLVEEKPDGLTKQNPIENFSQNEEKIVHKLPPIVKEEKMPAIVEKIQSQAQVVVKKGDSLEKIAKRNNVKVSDISKLNNLSNSFIKIGQTLLIPKNDSSIVQEKVIAKPIQKQIEKASNNNNAEFYVVKVGDNPYTIAMKHHIKPTELLKLNNLDEKKARRLKPGDKLRIR
ncbi:MAG: LysM peptidoglycan-binding domain-containing protein [Parachlamydiales bacterium]|nr:LysM peptidoglycan-binding domain-containing protein [Parachlamydiales bacterium]